MSLHSDVQLRVCLLPEEQQSEGYFRIQPTGLGDGHRKDFRVPGARDHSEESVRYQAEGPRSIPLLSEASACPAQSRPGGQREGLVGVHRRDSHAIQLIPSNIHTLSRMQHTKPINAFH